MAAVHPLPKRRPLMPALPRCRLCRAPLRDDANRFRGRALGAVLVPIDLTQVHRVCAFNLMEAVAQVQCLSTPPDHPDCKRWSALFFEIAALDPPRHVKWLLAGLPRMRTGAGR